MSKKPAVFHLERLTIDCARDVKAIFLEILAHPEGAVLDFEKTEAIDLAGIQLLLALFRDASRNDIVLKCTGPLAEQVAERLRLFGFCDDACDSAEKLCSTLSSFFG